MIISLEEAKRQCNVDELDHDAYLTELIAEAHDAVQRHTDRAIFATQAEMEAALQANPDLRAPMVATSGIKRGIKLLVGTWFANRESVVTGTIVAELPQGVDYVLDPYRNMSDQ